MSITSHIVTATPQSGTRNNTVYTFTDHVGGTVVVNKLLPYTYDAEADALAMYAHIAAQQADSEDNLAQGLMLAGTDPLALVLAPTYSTSKIMVKKLIRYMMRVRDPYLVFVLEPLIIHLRANYTNPQLLAFLDITAEQATKLNSRINAILDNRAILDTYDANAEEIE